MSQEFKTRTDDRRTVRVVLDGLAVGVAPGSTILAAAATVGITIPTLCHYRGIAPAGACRVCVVELKTPAGGRLVPSCHYAITDPLEVDTTSQRVVRSRRLTIELLMSRCPGQPALEKLADRYEVRPGRFAPSGDDCILCGLCTRVCQELMQVDALSTIGRGAEQRVAPPYDAASPVCISCGACAFVCPTGRIKLPDIYPGSVRENLSRYEERLVSAGKIHLAYPQQIPKVPVLDRDNCVKFLTGACGACEKICSAGAIDYDQQDREEQLNVGAVVVTPGFSLYDASKKGALGFGRYENVVTNLQFERILSASGPCDGQVRRPSDGEPPRKIAFLQCVGSRDTNAEGNPYCSSVCCMASIKEAVIAREHDRRIAPTIFYIDMRTHGKDFERYFEDARDKHGIVFRRSSVAKLYEKPSSRNLVVRYVDEDSREVRQEEFDLVVLAAGLDAPSTGKALAGALKIPVDEYGFCRGQVHPLPERDAEGVFAGGAFTEPRTIPESVVAGSAAASDAARLLGEVRGTMARKKKYPRQLDVASQRPRVGVFVCRCGLNIAGTVNVPEVTDFARSLPGVVYAGEFVYSCSQDSLGAITEAIHARKLNRVVVASCTPRTHAYLFADTIRQAGLNRHYFELVSVREQCSWVHMAQPAEATEKAKELVAMVVQKVRGARAVSLEYSPVMKHGLVIGAGVTGMNAALSLAEQGFGCTLVERDGALGGNYRRQRLGLDGLEPVGYLRDLEASVRNHPGIDIRLHSELVALDGSPGSFEASVRSGATGRTETLKCGAVIVATGAAERSPTEYAYGRDRRVVTQIDLEQELSDDVQALRGIETVVMIQCVGSREEPNLYCSRTCCTQAVRNALALKEADPDIAVYILYRDIRTYGFREALYRQAREAGVVFLRYVREDKPRVDPQPAAVHVTVRDHNSGRDILLTADRVVLSTGMAPQAGNEQLSKVLRVPLSCDGFFLEAHAKIRPLDFVSDGLFLAGLAHSPCFTSECIARGLGASARAAAILAKPRIESRPESVVVNERLCSGCGRCVAGCPYDAREIDDETRKAKVYNVLCQGCGSCAVVCPNGATGQNLFQARQILSMLEPMAADGGRESTA